MMKTFLAVIISVLIIFSNFNFAQDSNSIQITGGIIMPLSSSKGLTASFQFNHPINRIFQVYVYGAYASWDKFNVSYLVNGSLIQKQTRFNTYTSDSHTSIPIYAGGRLNFHTNKIFTAFAILEIGYTHLSYKSYQVNKMIDTAGVVLAYYPDEITGKEISENLIGIGTGAGLSHSLNKNVNLIFIFKLNSQINSKYYGFLSVGGTYTSYLAGFNFNI